MASVFIVHNRKQIVIIHYLHQVSCSGLPHLALFVIKLAHLPVKPFPSLHYSFKINHIIEVALNTGNLAYQCFDLLVTEYCSYTASAGLLQSHFFSFRIIKTEVEHADQ